LSLLAVLVLNGNLAGIILQYKAFNLMHGYIGMVAALLTYMSLQEAELISRGKWLNRIYRPVGLIITLVAALVLLVHQRLLSSGITHYWVSSVFPYPGAAVCYL
jgi:TctA family transporter